MWTCRNCHSVLNTDGNQCPACNILKDMKYADGRPAQHEPGNLVYCPTCQSRTRKPWPLLPGRKTRTCPVCLEREQRQAQQHNDEPDSFDIIQGMIHHNRQKQQYFDHMNRRQQQHQHYFDQQHTAYLEQQFFNRKPTPTRPRAKQHSTTLNPHTTPTKTPRLNTDKLKGTHLKPKRNSKLF